MRILYASERPPYPFFLGGAARCAHRLLDTLTRELGAQCVAVGSSDYRTTPWAYPEPSDYMALGILAAGREREGGRIDCGYPIHVLPDFASGLGGLVDTFEPDIVWAQLEGSLPVLELARSKGIQGLLFVHDAEFDPAELQAIGNLGCHVVCGSRFLAEKVCKVIGRDAYTIYPCPETNFGVAGDPNGYVTMVNPHRVKGVHTFVEIARRMPAERFLLVESWKLTGQGLLALEEQLASAPNVRFLRRVSDMRQVYGQTKLLLVPSVWEEGFGMVAVEAQSCRIPVVASARGGLPESVGDGGLLVEDYLNADAWVHAVGMVQSDAVRYVDFANRAARHAASEAFTTSSSARRFQEVCATKAPPYSPLSRGIRALVEFLNAVPGLRRVVRQIHR